MAIIRQYLICNIFILFSCVFFIRLSAQNTCSLYIRPVDTSVAVMQQLQLQPAFPSKKSCLQYIDQLPALLKTKGYISASIDSVQQDSASVTVNLFIGKQYTWRNLHIDNSTLEILNGFNYNSATFNNQLFSQEKVDAIYSKILDYYQNNGYPFAKINLDSIRIENNLISANLSVDKSIPYYIDSIHVNGKAKLLQEFIHRYLDISAHELYNAAKLAKIDERLAQLPYLQQSQPWTLTMLNDRAILNLYVTPKQSNQIDAVAGFLPANEQTGGKLLFTGQATINLKNAFAAGETIGINWQQLQAQSPRLDLLFQRPYIFHSPLGISFNFGLYKRDSFYVNINAYLGLQYALSSRQSGTIFLQTTSSRLLSVDTNTVILTKTLPQSGDINTVSVGFDYHFSNTNYALNPRSGNDLFVRISAGNKTVQKNNTIVQIKNSSFNYSSLYDTVQLKSYQFRIVASGAHYFAVGKQASFKTSVNAGWLQSPAYYINELFQIGGFRLLRGFDEESIYANRYAVATAEYHYLLGQNSYFYVFTDAGYAHYQSTVSAFANSYIGAGFGLAFETKSGIFNISYAAGKRNDTRLDFRQSKIHLGFVSVF